MLNHILMVCNIASIAVTIDIENRNSWRAGHLEAWAEAGKQFIQAAAEPWPKLIY